MILFYYFCKTKLFQICPIFEASFNYRAKNINSLFGKNMYMRKNYVSGRWNFYTWIVLKRSNVDRNFISRERKTFETIKQFHLREIGSSSSIRPTINNSLDRSRAREYPCNSRIEHKVSRSLKSITHPALTRTILNDLAAHFRRPPCTCSRGQVA